MQYPDNILRDLLCMALKFEEQKKKILEEYKDPNGTIVGYTKPNIEKMDNESLKLIKKK